MKYTPVQQTLWISGEKSSCADDNTKTCYLTKMNLADDWTISNIEINDFKFEEGFTQKIRIEQIEGSETNFKLVEQLEKNMDKKYQLHDLWSLRTIRNEELNLKDESHRPLLEFHIRENRIMGNASCNSIRGKILKADDKNLKFDKIASTKMMCSDMDTEKLLLKNLAAVRMYVIKDLSLVLLDENGRELLQFRKVD